MAKFKGHFHATYAVDAPLEATRNHLADLDAVVAHYGDTLERGEPRGDGVLALWLREQNYGVTRYRGHYVCRWEVVDPHTVRWRTEPGHNLDSSGTAKFSALPDGRTRMDYDITLVLDIDVGRLLAGVIGGIVSQAVAREARAYVERLVASVPRG